MHQLLSFAARAVPSASGTPAGTFVALLAFALSSLTALAGRPAAAEPLSPRNANYEIEASLDPEHRRVTARQVVTWRNIQDQPTSELWFHLYWNGFRNNQSTWMKENRLRGRSRIRRPETSDWGYLEVERIRLLDAAPDATTAVPPSDLAMDQVILEKNELTARYASPDDGNPDDRTVLVVDLERPVAPGETVRVELEWRSLVPRVFARTGVRNDFYFFAHWFPQLGVFEGDAWNCHQFHAATEFFADYGNYDVRLTLPDRFVLGATGRETEAKNNGDGTTTWRFVQEDVHGFTWTASPDYLVERGRFEVPGLPPVDLHLLYQKEHAHLAERHFDATRATLEHYGKWFGPYPYSKLTIVDPPYRSAVGGMEYPTLFTAGAGLSRPFGGGRPEGVIIHEAGHQFWYGIVGNNEQEHAWLDEGLNTFSTARAYEAAYGESIWSKSYLSPPGLRGRGFFSVLFPDVKQSRAISGSRWRGLARNGTANPQSDPTYLYYPPHASNLSYGKTAIWLHTLERYLGWETLREILATFFERFQFRHPKPADFFAVANEVAGQDLGWFFDQVYASTVSFDYGIESLTSSPVKLKGLVELESGEIGPRPEEDRAAGKEDRSELFRTEVVVRRYAEGIFPLELLLVFEDGSEARHAWDGRDSWTVFAEERASRLAYAALDPERVLLLDIDYSNNSRRLEAAARFPARKWASKWMVWLQDLLSTYTFYI